MRLSFKIASRFLRFNFGQTLLIVTGIAIGVSVQVFIGLLIQGLQQDLVNRTIGSSSQVTISANKEIATISGWEEIIEGIVQNEQGVNQISPAADGAAFLVGEESSDPVIVRGWIFEDAEGIYAIEEKLIEGKVPGEGEVIIGLNLKDELGLSIEDDIKLATATGRIQDYKISGFYDFRVSSINSSWVITDIKSAQGLFDYGDEVTSIEMQVQDVFAADIIADSINNRIDNEDLIIDNWKAQNQELLSGLNGQSISSIMIQVFVMVSVVLGISSVLAITVMQKSKEIGILKAMGIRDGDASRIFLLQGLILGVFGAMLGVALGLGLSVAFTKFALNPDGTPVIAFYINYGFIALSGGIAILASLVASFIPARKSLKLNPIEVIRNG
ncbi:ABC transporter permease [Alkalibacter saccharofermentans]|uniref:Lipoprotein-releasing system permease protein n=1 Tax=Alkalibacter saccharofermentans DSM 14828 TaxID=1120975 RepID=A0A1M4TF94_9FIRM|nr:ABC transporter permease [Alkalibacter saccharofermentans]SHE43160.1 lipoprotein-releasing system permease protein [Alkalibacter saccharofermentans DSM 14828]